MQSINEVFEDLDKRIDQLKKFPSILNYYQHLKDEYDIAKIERNIYLFEEVALPRIEMAIKELEGIKKRGISLITTSLGIDFFDKNDYRLNLSEEELKVDHEKQRTRAYQLLKNEIDFYISKLAEIKKSILIKTKSKEKTPILAIGTDFDFPKWKTDNSYATTILTQGQSVLFFHYLKENKIILPYLASSLADIVMKITGYSENTSRSSFSDIGSLKARKSNLELLKKTLLNLIEQIEVDLKKAKN